MNAQLFDDTYTGPRWTYGLKFRPLRYANVPDGWIIFSDRPCTGFGHGCVDYPRELTADEVDSFQLTRLSFTAEPSKPVGGTDR